MSEGLTACGLVFGIIFLAVAVAVAGNRRQQASQVKRARYVVHVPTEETRDRLAYEAVYQAAQNNDVSALEETRFVDVAGGVQVWHGNKRTEYFIRDGWIYALTGKTARKIEDETAWRIVTAKLKLADVIWE